MIEKVLQKGELGSAFCHCGRLGRFENINKYPKCFGHYIVYLIEDFLA